MPTPALWVKISKALEIDFTERLQASTERLHAIERFEAVLFDRLAGDLPTENLDRIVGSSEVDDSEDGGRLAECQAEIRSLIRWIPLYRRNVFLQAELRKRLRKQREVFDAAMIHSVLSVPAAISKWARETSQTEPREA